MASVLCHFLPLLLGFLLPLLAVAQYEIILGSSLSADDNSSWLSPSGDYAFGFRRQINDVDSFLLAIWFDKIPDKTILWYANGDNLAPRGSKVELTSGGQLVLNDPQGKEIWKAELNSNYGVAYGAMLNTGNFVLAGYDSRSVWESFKKPTDTILPSQILEIGDKLSSRQKEANYSKGRFQLRLLPDGNLVLNSIGLPTETAYDAYYISNTYEADRNYSGHRVVFNESGDIYIVRRNGTRLNLTSRNIAPITDFYYRATLDFDGVFTQYAHPRNTAGDNRRWFNVWFMPDDICAAIPAVKLGSGACGFNSYCTLTSDRRPYCQCLPDYSFVDPNNNFSDCQPKFSQGCPEDGSRTPEDLFDMRVMENLNFPMGDYHKFESYNEEDCKKSCLHDCFCAVAIFGTECWKKKLPLSNGRRETGALALIKVRKADSLQEDPHPRPHPPISGQGKNDKAKLILLGTSASFNFVLLSIVTMVVFFTYHKKLNKTNPDASVLETNLPSFTYKELQEATDGFKEELGKGAFGVVYKGVLALSSKKFVAVKKLDNMVEEREKEFKTEVSVIGQTHHKNLVRLLGFCEEGPHRLLVYEFMNNGSLASFLFGISKPDWNQRTEIAFGIARGLMYLHEECSTQIIHCDIKPQNILLDDCFKATISDFGLAKLLMSDQSLTRTVIRGTRGYVAPEWFRNIPITTKVDVYSFGVMLLEIICCRKSMELDLEDEGRAILTDWSYDCFREGKLNDLVENDEEAMKDMRRLEMLVMIAIWCIQEEPSLRPTMKKVTQMLEGDVEVSVPPCPCPFTSVS